MIERGSEEHKRFSPSQADRFFLCTGSTELIATAPPRPQREDATEGDNAHHLLETSLKNGCIPAKQAWELTEFSFLDLDENMCSAVDDAIDYVREVMDDLPGATMYTEVFLDPPVEIAPGEAGGRCDVLIIHDLFRVIYVIDYKHGVGVSVDVESSRQVKQYACGALFGGAFFEPEFCWDYDVNLVIIQPRSFAAAGAIREYQTTPIDLMSYMAELEEAIAANLAGERILTPGEKQCQFCDGAATCPALESKALSTIGRSYETLKTLSKDGLPDPSAMDLERLAYVKQAAPIVRKWLQECDAAALAMARQGHTIPGFKIVEALARRRYYGNSLRVASQLMALTNRTLNEVMPRKLLNITDAEALVVQAAKEGKRGKRAKADAAAAAKQAMAFLTLKDSSGELTLAPVSDSRPAYNVMHAFSNVNLPKREGTDI